MNNQEYIENTIEHMKQRFICERVVKTHFDKEFQKSYIYYKKRFDDYMEKCKSPIEKLMCAILFQTEAYFEVQEKIEKYTVDFIIDLTVGEDCNYIVIECDGHDFHEKTKAQVTKNNERDMDLKKAGYDVIHFNGSQIFNNPMKCANDTIDLIIENIGKITKVGDKDA